MKYRAKRLRRNIITGRDEWVYVTIKDKSRGDGNTSKNRGRAKNDTKMKSTKKYRTIS